MARRPANDRQHMQASTASSGLARCLPFPSAWPCLCPCLRTCVCAAAAYPGAELPFGDMLPATMRTCICALCSIIHLHMHTKPSERRCARCTQSGPFLLPGTGSTWGHSTSSLHQLELSRWSGESQYALRGADILMCTYAHTIVSRTPNLALRGRLIWSRTHVYM